jgi:hypothetical protein
MEKVTDFGLGLESVIEQIISCESGLELKSDVFCGYEPSVLYLIITPA